MTHFENMNCKAEYREILGMIDSACTRTFYSGSKNHEDTIIKCATQIYIAQMSINSDKKAKENEND